MMALRLEGKTGEGRVEFNMSCFFLLASKRRGFLGSTL